MGASWRGRATGDTQKSKNHNFSYPPVFSLFIYAVEIVKVRNWNIFDYALMFIFTYIYFFVLIYWSYVIVRLDYDHYHLIMVLFTPRISLLISILRTLFSEVFQC